MTTLLDIVAEARTWIDTRYEHQHREKGHYVDCVGLIIGVGRDLGLLAPDFDLQGYARRPDGVTMQATCDRYMRRVPMGEVRPGHVMLLRFGDDPQHLGFIGDYAHGGNSLIHSFSDAKPYGRVVEHRLMRTKLMVPLQGYLLPGLES